MKIVDKLIYFKIKEMLDPIILNVLNESYKHKNHFYYNKYSHFFLEIVSNEFINKTNIVRHKMVYNILFNFKKYNIHSLRLRTYTLNEIRNYF